MAHTFTRQELYDLVWADPTSVVAKTLGVSGVWLRKNCIAANIPVPERGYWARKKVGQTVRRAQLPERGLGQLDEIAIGRDAAAWYPQDAEVGDPPPLKTFPESLDDIRRRASKLVGRVTASRSLDKTHSVIALLLEEDERRRVALQQNRYAWEKPRFDSPDSRRRLRILNGLFLGLSRAGFVPWVRGKDSLEWGVRVGDWSVQIKLEAIEQKRSTRAEQSQRGRTSPIRLRLTLDHLPEYPDLFWAWEDQDEKTIEKQIGELAVAIAVRGEMGYRAWVIRCHRWHVERRNEYLENQRLKREEEERKRREEILRLAAERRKRLLTDTKAWRLAADVRGFIDAVCERYVQPKDIETDERFKDWITWATDEANRIDPLVKPLAQLIEYATEKRFD